MNQDQLGLRIAGTFDRQSGWIDEPAADHQDKDLANVRIKSLWKPAEQLTLSFLAQIHRNEASITCLHHCRDEAAP
jgi:hypothetical protein